MRPRFNSIFMATLSAIAVAFLFAANWSSMPLGALPTAAAADNSGAPTPGDVSTPTLIPPAPAPGDDASSTPKGAEVLSQGPVHEAFAKPLELDPKPGPIVKKEPPAAIKEIPPEQQPDGDNIVWIPGYWSWDDDRNDFIWVSGVLRAAPPGQTWVPGYWSKADAGYQWTPGLWTSTSKQEVAYLPQPPQSLENGPSSPQPADNQFWIPGTYVYQNNDYLWRPGYWTVARPNWIWIPSHFCWTPGGYVFVDGYWDYELTRRGCLFAPVYFAQPIYAQPAFVYTPSVVFNIGLFNDCLFVRPSYCHYYFGDYFGPSYATIGFSPWFSLSFGGRPRCDPLFTYYRWHNSINDRNWLAHTQQHFDQLRHDETLRPPHTFAAQQQWMKNNPSKSGNLALVSPLKDVARDPSKSDFKFHNVSIQDRQVLANKGNELQQVALQRDNLERKNGQQFSGRGQTGATSTSGGLNSPKTGLTLNNSAAGSNGNAGNSSAGSFNGAGAGGAAKLKLPTAAASKMMLSDNTQSNGSNQNSGSSNQKFDNNKFTNQNLGANQQNAGGQQNRPGLIQPNNAVLTGNGNQGKTSSGNAGANLFSGQGAFQGQGAGNANSGSGQSANQNSSRSQLIPSFGGNPTGNAGGASGTGTKAFNRGSGGGGGGGGGSGGGNKDKDDKKNKTSSDTSPHPYTDYEKPKPSLIDVRENMKADRKDSKVVTSLTGDPHSKASSSGLDLGHQEQASDSSAEDDSHKSSSEKDSAAKKSKKYSYQPPSLFTKHTSSDVDPRLKWLLGDQNKSSQETDQSPSGETAAPDSDMPDSAPGSDHLSGNSPTDSTPSGKMASGIPSTARSPQGPAPPRNPASYKYDYQTLMEQGRNLSTRTSYAASPLGMPSTDSDIPAPMPRASNDTVSPIGMGSQKRSMYGPSGLSPSAPAGLGYGSGTPTGPGYLSGMPAGPLSAGSDAGLPRGSGSYMSNSSLPQLPRFDLHMAKPTGPATLPDPSSRTYDPGRGY
jgi:WXXGXW repeat (2 copies)